MGIFFLTYKPLLRNIQKIRLFRYKKEMPAQGGHDNALDPSTSLRMTRCKAVHFDMTMLWIPSLTVEDDWVEDDKARGYFTKRSISATEFAMRFLKFQMRAKVLP